MISLNYKYVFLSFILFLFLPASGYFCQNVSEVEKRYVSVSIALNTEQRKLDSLNALLNDRAANISKEKKKNSSDKEKITSLMSNSISLSNQINEVQKKVIILESKREELKSSLRRVYSRIIDSLNTAKLKGDKNPDTEIQILTYSEKKLSIVQKFPDLSFSPAMIISVDPSSINNPEERKIFKEYLTNALAEIQSKISYVEKQYSENSQVLSLQQKAEKFIEETEYTDSYRFSKNRNGAVPAVEADFNNSRDYMANAENVKGMLNQFRAIQSGNIKPRSILTTNFSNISLKEYQALLKELKENLTAFRTILNHKIKSFE